MTDPQAQWGETSYELNIKVGPITPFRPRFRALVSRRDVLELPPDPIATDLPLDRLGHGIEVIVIRSHPVTQPLPLIARVGRALRFVPQHHARYYTDLTGGFDRYLARFSPKTRQTLRRKVRRFLDAAGGSGMRQYRAPAEMHEFHRLARTVSELTYQERLLDAGFPRTDAFRAELVESAQRGSIRGYLLFLGERPVAYLCCPADNGKVLYRYLGYDPTQSHLSPGTVLQYLALESLFAEGAFRVFDYMEGDTDQKRLFSTEARTCALICYFHPSVRVYFWIGLRLLLDGVAGATGRTLERLGVKATIKRWLRRH